MDDYKKFRIIDHGGIYAIQKHYPNGWRDCIDCQWYDTLEEAKKALVKKETEYFMEENVQF